MLDDETAYNEPPIIFLQMISEGWTMPDTGQDPRGLGEQLAESE